MTTDKNKKYLSERVYGVNSEKEDEKVRVNDKLKEGFQVLAVENDITNSMQAMAVAPVDSKGEIEIFKKLNNQIKRV